MEIKDYIKKIKQNIDIYGYERSIAEGEKKRSFNEESEKSATRIVNDILELFEKDSRSGLQELIYINLPLSDFESIEDVKFKVNSGTVVERVMKKLTESGLKVRVVSRRMPNLNITIPALCIEIQ
jgi:hypothetical protein